MGVDTSLKVKREKQKCQDNRKARHDKERSKHEELARKKNKEKDDDANDGNKERKD